MRTTRDLLCWSAPGVWAVAAQLTRLPGDTIGVAVHFSATAQAVNSGSSARPSQCTSTGRGEVEFLDEVIQRVGGTGKRM